MSSSESSPEFPVSPAPHAPPSGQAPASSVPRNNFDLIRLFAAGQVAITHGLLFFGVFTDLDHIVMRVLYLFPGVPVFFFISGFLISASYNRSASLGQFFSNRALRIFPALWACFAVSVLLVWISGYFATDAGAISAKGFGAWVAAQVSFAQFYNPDFMRSYGTGVLNGSLWTIPVELQFYLMMPVLAVIYGALRKAYWAVFLGLVVLNIVHAQYIDPALGERTLIKLFGVTFLPWIAMFMAGHLVRMHWDRLKGYFEGTFLIWLVVYLVLVAGALMLEDATGLDISGNRISFPMFLILSCVALSAAYSKRGVSARILGEHDISYGVYIYHMPIYNFWLYMGFTQNLVTMLLCVALIFATAALSWILIERPALRMKKSTLFQR